MRKYIVVSIVSSFAICLIVVSCGGGGGAQQIDKASFVERANQICKQVSGRMAAKFTSITQRESAKPSYDVTKTQVLVVEEALVPGLEEELQQIRALGVPKEAKKETKALLEAYRQSIDTTKANPKIGIRSTPSYETVELVGARFGIPECPVAPVNTAS